MLERWQPGQAAAHALFQRFGEVVGSHADTIMGGRLDDKLDEAAAAASGELLDLLLQGADVGLPVADADPFVEVFAPLVALLLAEQLVEVGAVGFHVFQAFKFDEVVVVEFGGGCSSECSRRATAAPW